MTDHRLEAMLEELLALEEGLTEWEANFVESLSREGGDFTPAQAAKLEEIWNRRIS